MRWGGGRCRSELKSAELKLHGCRQSIPAMISSARDRERQLEREGVRRREKEGVGGRNELTELKRGCESALLLYELIFAEVS